MVDSSSDRERYLKARGRAAEAFWLAESLRDARLAAEHLAADHYEAIVREAETSSDVIVRRAAAGVRLQRAALRRAGDLLAAALQEVIERLVSVDADAGFGQEADALVLLAAEGRAGLAERYLAVARAEAALDGLLWPSPAEPRP